MISPEDSLTTYAYDGYYKILPAINDWHLDRERIKDGKKVENGFNYSSDTNTEWMTKNQLKDFLKNL